MKDEKFNKEIKVRLIDLLNLGSLDPFFEYVTQNFLSSDSVFLKAISEVKSQYSKISLDFHQSLISYDNYIGVFNKIRMQIVLVIENSTDFKSHKEYIFVEQYANEISKLENDIFSLKNENDRINNKIIEQKEYYENIVDKLTTDIELFKDSRGKVKKSLNYNTNNYEPIMALIPSKKIYIFKDKKGTYEEELRSFSVKEFFISNTKISFKDYYRFLIESKIMSLNVIKSFVLVSFGEIESSPIFYDNTTLSLRTTDSNIPALVTYEGAIQYCEWLKHVTRVSYSIPNEAEWVAAYLQYSEIDINNDFDSSIHYYNSDQKNINLDYIKQKYNFKLSGKLLKDMSLFPREWCQEVFSLEDEIKVNRANSFLLKGPNLDDMTWGDNKEYYSFRIIKKYK